METWVSLRSLVSPDASDTVATPSLAARSGGAGRSRLDKRWDLLLT